MDVSALSGYSTAISLIESLYPTSRVTAATLATGALTLASTQTSISNLGLLLNASEALATSASTLAAPGALAARTATSSKTAVTTATAGGDTATGAYAVQVDQLAQAQTLTTAAQASSLVRIGSGAPTTLRFDFASGVSREVALGGGADTLAGIASAINAADIGITAEVQSSEAGYRLALTGQTGAANAFTVAVTGDEDIAALLAYPPGGTGPALTRPAQDARGLVDGVAFTASTNAVNTAVPGLTLNLAGLGSATVNVAPNGGQAQTVSAFVAAYNAVQGGLGGLGQDSPPLALSAFYLRTQLAGALETGSAAGGTADLARIGITARSDGSLAFDATKFQSALNADPAAVGRVFSNEGKGVAERVKALSAEALSSAKLLEFAAPALSSPANLAQSFRATLFASVFDAGSLGFDAGSNLADQFLFAALTGAGRQDGGQDNDALLELLSRSQSLSRNLSGLGSQLGLLNLL